MIMIDSAANTPKFRTHQEMMEIGNVRHLDENHGPYVVEGESQGKLLMFVGCSHSNNPEHRQWPLVRAKWDAFLAHNNPKKHVFIEGWVRKMEGSQAEVIAEHGDAGFINMLAQEDGVEHSCVEPDRGEEARYLREKFTPHEVLAYYFARQLEAWARGGKETCPSWEEWIQKGMWKYGQMEEWSDQDLSLDSLVGVYEEVFAHSLDPEDRPKLNDESNPALNPVASACNDLRDRKLFESIVEKLHQGYDIFVNYGSGHIITMEPALRKLIDE